MTTKKRKTLQQTISMRKKLENLEDETRTL